MESKMKKKLATAIGGVAVVGAAVSLTAGTFSYFSDTATSSPQTFSTGTLKIGGSYQQAISVSNAIPGASATTSFTIKNVGTVPGYLSMALLDQGSDPVMLKNLSICLDSMGCAPLGVAEATTANGYSFGEIDPGSSKTFTVTVTLPDSGVAQNDLQGAQASAAVKATLKSVQ